MTDKQTPPPEAVAMARLRKRIEKLTKQRDYFMERCQTYGAVMNLHPMMEMRFKRYQEEKAERERVQGLEKRIKEQALLIDMLRK
jgi:hypothetical protein